MSTRIRVDTDKDRTSESNGRRGDGVESHRGAGADLRSTIDGAEGILPPAQPGHLNLAFVFASFADSQNGRRVTLPRAETTGPDGAGKTFECTSYCAHRASTLSEPPTLLLMHRRACCQRPELPIPSPSAARSLLRLLRPIRCSETHQASSVSPSASPPPRQPSSAPPADSPYPGQG